MIKRIFFDVGGVLGASALEFSYFNLSSNGKNISKDRLRNLFYDRRLTTCPDGALKNLLSNEFKDLGLMQEDVLNTFEQLPIYKENLDIVRQVKEKGIAIGIISDQFAESALILERRIPNFLELFNPVLFSSHIGCTKSSKEIFYSAMGLVEYSFENELLMVDDNKQNLDIARSLGWSVLLYKHPQSLKEELLKLGVL